MAPATTFPDGVLPMQAGIQPPASELIKFDGLDNVVIRLFCHSGFDPESSVNRLWIPAPAPDTDPGFAGMTV